MLFNSYFFIFCFFPVTFAGYYMVAAKFGGRAAITFLVFCSLFFYGWWDISYLYLILGSIIFNFQVGKKLHSHYGQNKKLLVTGILANCLLLGYFKYAYFLIDTLCLNGVVDFGGIVLPLAISFFTFQQIAFLVDAYRGEIVSFDFTKYCFFITFFPQLIAGPIVHHREVMPQLSYDKPIKIKFDDISVGLTIFAFGLFKKVVFADSIGLYSDILFAANHAGTTLSFFESWLAALAYTLQIYFDFSGYSDMAIGLSRVFGINLPINFFSPYKAVSIVDFWRRWHISLSRFLKENIFIPLGGSRIGRYRTSTNLLITMLIGGLWHGASWTFILWGGIHGGGLVVNHGLVQFIKQYPQYDIFLFKKKYFSQIFTFIFIVVAWVFFRSETISDALHLIHSMFVFNGMFPNNIITSPWRLICHVSVLLGVVWLLPNIYQMMGGYGKAIRIYRKSHSNVHEGIDLFRLKWHPNFSWAIIVSFIMLFSLWHIDKTSHFLYFQF